MKAVPREARLRIAARIDSLRQWEPRHEGTLYWEDLEYKTIPGKPFSKAEANAVAATLDAVADYWDAHPTQWIKGAGFSRGNRGSFQMCNIGVIETSLQWNDDPEVGQKPSAQVRRDFKAPRKGISLVQAYEVFIIDLNDNSKDLAENVAGLRIVANAYRDFATTKDWPGALNRAMAHNTRLLKVQIQRLGKKNPKLARSKARRLATIGAK